MPDFEWEDQDGKVTATCQGGLIYVQARDVDESTDFVFWPDELDALAVAWLRWRADEAPADIERLLAAAEGEAH